MGEGQVKDAIFSEHYVAGRRLGLQGSSIEMVPGVRGTPEHDEAMRGWRSGTSSFAYQNAMRCEA